MLQEKDEKGVIPPNALSHALNQLDSARVRGGAAQAQIAGVPSGGQVLPAALVGRAVMPTAGLNPGHTGWSALGPGNIGGRTRASSSIQRA